MVSAPILKQEYTRSRVTYIPGYTFKSTMYYILSYKHTNVWKWEYSGIEALVGVLIPNPHGLGTKQ